MYRAECLSQGRAKDYEDYLSNKKHAVDEIARMEEYLKLGLNPQRWSYEIQTLQENATARHDQVVSQMRAAIENNAQMQAQNATITHNNRQPSQPQPIAQPVTQSTSQPQSSMQPTAVTQPQPIQPPQPPALPQNETANITQPQPIAENPLSDEVVRTNDAIIKPDSVTEAIKAEEEKRNAEAEAKAAAEAAKAASQPNQSIIDLANNTDFSIETIAQQAKRIQEKKNDEVYISLH